MSYKKVFSRKDRIATRFLAQVHAAIAQAAVSAKHENKLTQKEVADELGVDKSVISRILKGVGNPTIRTVGELSAALGYRPELVLRKINSEGGNHSFTVRCRPDGIVVAHPANSTTSSTANANASALPKRQPEWTTL